MLLFISAQETKLIQDGATFVIINTAFFCLLVIVNVFRFSIQGLGYSGFAIIAGVMEMIARGLISLVFVPLFGFISVCFGSPLAWVLADMFLIPAYIHVMKKIKKEYMEV